MTQLRAYRIALILSLIINVVLVAVIALYVHFAGLLSIIEDAVGFLG